MNADKLSFIRKLRPIALSAESDISPLESFHDKIVADKIEKIVMNLKQQKDKDDYKFD